MRSSLHPKPTCFPWYHDASDNDSGQALPTPKNSTNKMKTFNENMRTDSLRGVLLCRQHTGHFTGQKRWHPNWVTLYGIQTAWSTAKRSEYRHHEGLLELVGFLLFTRSINHWWMAGQTHYVVTRRQRADQTQRHHSLLYEGAGEGKTRHSSSHCAVHSDTVTTSRETHTAGWPRG